MKTSSVGILGLQAGEDVKGPVNSSSIDLDRVACVQVGGHFLFSYLISNPSWP